MSLVRLDIRSIVMGSGPISSLIVLAAHDKGDGTGQLPIRIGSFEAAAITMGIDSSNTMKRPLTHDVLRSTIQSLDAHLLRVVITRVEGTTFFAQLHLRDQTGKITFIDARPSDAIALAVRMHAPIFAEQDVLKAATLPDFAAVERDEREKEAAAFHDFVEGLTPDDFAS